LLFFVFFCLSSFFPSFFSSFHPSVNFLFFSLGSGSFYFFFFLHSWMLVFQQPIARSVWIVFLFVRGLVLGQ
jgi:hypothetical protein